MMDNYGRRKNPQLGIDEHRFEQTTIKEYLAVQFFFNQGGIS